MTKTLTQILLWAEGNNRVKAGMAMLTVGGRSIDERVIATRESENLGAADGGTRVQLAGRTDTDLIVLFDAPAGRSAAELIGRSVRVRVERASVLTLFGVVESD